MTPSALWNNLGGLPPLFGAAVFALALLALACFVALPLLLLLRHEPADLRRFVAARRGALPGVLGKVQLCMDTVNAAVGFATAWFALFMVLMQFTVVIMRYVFSYGSIMMQESIWYMHGLLFMLGAGYTLLREAHVRLDVFYSRFTVRARALVNLLGCALLLMPLCAFTWWLSWSFVVNSWAVMEGSTETSGLPLIYLYKTVILVFAALVGAQSVSLAAAAIAALSGGGAENGGTDGENGGRRLSNDGHDLHSDGRDGNNGEPRP
ncbi:MAG: TRAP transporter small permease subunit [Gammaproteobacteria bacterium]|nr:TRAP transporter small permease subunit [Gammaproteobacteria bacterium]MDD9870194.1 TRAP transporter small permease subunit [Gammaproteobacteria bacterium]